MYIDNRFKKMKKDVNPIYMMIGMILRISILFMILTGGKFFCDWAVDKSHNTVSSYELKKYTNSKLKIIKDLRIKKLITKSELKEKIKKVYANPKQDYLKEKKNHAK